jgi:isochorismate synthase
MSGGWSEVPTPEARPGWESKVREALDGINDPDGVLAKVVLARRTSYRSEDAGEGVAAARGLRERFTGSTVFCFDEGRGRQFLGATPELLIRKRGHKATTISLAGTAECGADPAALLESDKNRREQRYVTDAIRSRLEGLATSVEVDAAPSLRRHGNVVHLQTGLAATLRPSVSLLQTLGELHPTPALAGSPRRESLAFIARHEPDERGWYAGPVGWLDQRGDGEFHVALRCGLLAGKRAWAFAGAGIVDGSVPSVEWEETENKLFAFRCALESGEVAQS